MASYPVLGDADDRPIPPAGPFLLSDCTAHRPVGRSYWSGGERRRDE